MRKQTVRHPILPGSPARFLHWHILNGALSLTQNGLPMAHPAFQWCSGKHVNQDHPWIRIRGWF